MSDQRPVPRDMGPPPQAREMRDPANTFARILFDPKTMAQIAAALPKHMAADRMARIMLTEFRKTPALQRCDAFSVIGALIQCSQLGLEPGGGRGHVYLIPYGRECQVVVGYQGMIDLIKRSGQVTKLVARIVHEGDDFDYAFGLDERLDHAPQTKKPGAMTHVYAIATFKDGSHHFDVMRRDEVEEIRNRKKGWENGPWKTDFEEMAKKTAIRRIAKYLPMSVELQAVAALERGDTIDISALISDADPAAALPPGDAAEPPPAHGTAQP